MSLDFYNWFEKLDKCTEAQDDYHSALIYVVTHNKPCYYIRKHKFMVENYEEDSQGNKFFKLDLPRNDNDYVEYITVKTNWKGKVEFSCAGRTVDRVHKFLFCSAPYTPLEVKYTGEPDDFKNIEVTYKAWLFTSEMRRELMHKKVKLGDWLFYNGMATLMK